MKLSKFIILISFICLPIFGQVDEYFPLHLGDTWVYWYSEYIYSVKWTYEVVEVDSLEDNSVVYTVYKNKNPYQFYKIYNDNKSILYANYFGLDSSFSVYLKFGISEGETWNRWKRIWMRLKEKNVDTLWSIYPWAYPDSTLEYEMAGDSLMTFVFNETYYIKGLGLYLEKLEGGSRMDLAGCIIDGIPYGALTDVENEPTPNSYELTIQNYPNPFNNQTVIQYTIPENEFVKITMYDMLGREIETLVDEVRTQGKHSIPWQAKGLSSGVYFAVLKYQNKIATQKIIYQK